MSAGIRALHSTARGRLFAVYANGLYEISPDASMVRRGTLQTSTGMVTIAESIYAPLPTDMRSVSHLVIEDGRDTHVYNCTTNVLTRLAIEGLPSGTHVVNIDGYFIKNESETDRFWYSALRDGYTWDGDFYSAEGSPDRIMGLGKLNNELWVFGEATTEIWYSTGDADNLFQRVNQGFLNIGLAARNGFASNGSQMFWIGANEQGHGIIWTATSYNPQRISTHAIEYVISTMPRIDDAVAYCYQSLGHSFFVITFPSGDRTIVYDLATGLWHERGEWDDVRGVMHRHRSQVSAFWQGMVIVGDYNNGNIYELDENTYTDNGRPVRRIRTGQHVRQDRKRIYHTEIEFDVERGVGLTDPTEYGFEPTYTLDMSDDGGKTWGRSRQLLLGKKGEYQTNVSASRLGMSRDRVYRLSITDPVKCVITGARADLQIEGE